MINLIKKFKDLRSNKMIQINKSNESILQADMDGKEILLLVINDDFESSYNLAEKQLMNESNDSKKKPKIINIDALDELDDMDIPEELLNIIKSALDPDSEKDSMDPIKHIEYLEKIYDRVAKNKSNLITSEEYIKVLELNSHYGFLIKNMQNELNNINRDFQLLFITNTKSQVIREKKLEEIMLIQNFALSTYIYNMSTFLTQKKVVDKI